MKQEHYEAQYIPSRGALEIGFHSEHSKRGLNDDVVAQLVAFEKKWRRVLGEAEVGPFIGAQSGTWRRVSEVWGPAHWDMEPPTAVEAAERLADYINTFEPLRSG